MTKEQALIANRTVENIKESKKLLDNFKKTRTEKIFSEQGSRDAQAIRQLLDSTTHGFGTILTHDVLASMVIVAQVGLETRIEQFSKELEAM